jgi:hypothetical protein
VSARGIVMLVTIAVTAACGVGSDAQASLDSSSNSLPSASLTSGVTVGPTASIDTATPTRSGTRASPGRIGEFPSEVDGMPTISIGDAKALLAADRLDGRAVAVWGYWIATMIPSCPAPGRWISPLESYCHFDVFSDTTYPGFTCTPIANGGTSCQGNQPPAGAHTLSPRILTESAGQNELW